MANQEKISFADFQKRFNSEDACREYLYKLRWPNRFICPKCGGVDCYHIIRRNKYQCAQCRYQASVTSGTVMHKSKLSLQTWFWAIYLVSRDKRGYSATQLEAELNIAYSSAWYLLHRIRSAMAERDSEYMLSAIVELDDTYFGAPTEGGKRGRGTEKTKVMVAVSKTKNGKPDYLKMKIIDNLRGETVGDFAKAFIVKGSTVQSDTYRSYQKPLADDFEHQFEVFDSNSDTLKWLHTLVGNAKAFVNGTFHGLGDKHLQSYLDEFCYRFNRRDFRNQIFPRLLCAVVNSNILGYADLTR
ncbi:IS1595 family transposase [Sinanaerobacter chloroacetimidivorans]|uniref:IS1595 family transposase n=1 Tax=Sinanaerobacter chloroacetimidivorans TaxID=2818044 RepID=A0A8J7W3Y1_9FIRM|nr:IS1595 family transposase [Sinanaerobacter chloroacetimidivorans]MBR0600064.1 IS1595 family transposase [Sinanaerobacter chloroacetimidivorans]